MADDKTISTDTASAVTPPKTKPDAETVEPSKAPAKKAEPEPSVDARQMTERGKRTEQFRRQSGSGRPGRPRSPRAGGYVLTKDGWKPDKKATAPQPGKPQVTFREGEGSTIKNAGGYAVAGAEGKPKGKRK